MVILRPIRFITDTLKPILRCVLYGVQYTILKAIKITKNTRESYPFF